MDTNRQKPNEDPMRRWRQIVAVVSLAQIASGLCLFAIEAFPNYGGALLLIAGISGLSAILDGRLRSLAIVLNLVVLVGGLLAVLTTLPAYLMFASVPMRDMNSLWMMMLTGELAIAIGALISIVGLEKIERRAS